MNKGFLETMYVAAGLAVLATMMACSTAPSSPDGKDVIRNEAAATLDHARANDPSLAHHLRTAHGYAVFPSIGKGGALVGGAYGKGVLYENERQVGYCDMTQVTVGAQLGGQSYSEIICFEDSAATTNFRQGNLNFDAQTSAVALKSGAGANAKYRNGVTVFTMNETGLMAEASVGGQQFTYQAN